VVFTGTTANPTFVAGDYVPTGSNSTLSTIARFRIEQTTVIPEPSTLALAAAGALGVGAVAVRGRARA
jgi:hypothetical protein